MGATAGDYDNDGRTDLFVPGVQRNLLYRNTGDRFTEVSNKAGIHDEIWSVAAAWSTTIVMAGSTCLSSTTWLEPGDGSVLR